MERFRLRQGKMRVDADGEWVEYAVVKLLETELEVAEEVANQLEDRVFLANELLAACKSCFQDYRVMWQQADGAIVCSDAAVDYEKGTTFEVYLTRKQMDAIKIAIVKAEGT